MPSSGGGWILRVEPSLPALWDEWYATYVPRLAPVHDDDLMANPLGETRISSPALKGEEFVKPVRPSVSPFVDPLSCYRLCAHEAAQPAFAASSTCCERLPRGVLMGREAQPDQTLVVSAGSPAEQRCRGYEPTVSSGLIWAFKRASLRLESRV